MCFVFTCPLMKNTNPLHVERIKANLDTAESIRKGDFWQAILDAAYADWQAKGKMSYTGMLNAAARKNGQAAKLFILLGKYDSQVCNGGHIQYFDNGYGSGDGGCLDSHDVNCPLHREMICLFKKYNLASIPGGIEVLDILESFHVVTGDDGTVANLSELDRLDSDYYAICEAWEQTVVTEIATSYFRLLVP